MPDVKRARADIRDFRAREWKLRYCREHRLYRKDARGVPAEDIRAAPEPADADLDWPEPMITAAWDSGYITMTLTAYNKLKARDKKLFARLGGLEK